MMDKKRILFVDDDDNMLQSLQRMLAARKNSLDLFFAHSGAEAVELLDQYEFYMVVADYKMPGMDGLTLLGKVRDMNPGARRVLLTGQPDREVFEKSGALVHNYLAKPCNSDELVNVIGD